MQLCFEAEYFYFLVYSLYYAHPYFTGKPSSDKHETTVKNKEIYNKLV